MSEQTLGQRRVRVSFNPQGSLVDQIKQKTAELIDLMQAIKNTEASKTYEKSQEEMREQSGERFRVIDLAQTAYEEAGHWAVKAATLYSHNSIVLIDLESPQD